MDSSPSLNKNLESSLTDETMPDNQLDDQKEVEELSGEAESLTITGQSNDSHYGGKEMHETNSLQSDSQEDVKHVMDGILIDEKEVDLGDDRTEAGFDGTEASNMDSGDNPSNHPLDVEPEVQGSVWPEKAVALKNFVKEKGVVAVSSVFRRLSGVKDEDGGLPDEKEKCENMPLDSQETNLNTGERSTWNPLNYINFTRDTNGTNHMEGEAVHVQDVAKEPVMKGRIILYTRLGCQNCKEIRSYLQQKGIKYVEINTDIYPSRKVELEKISGSSSVPKLYFNDFLVEGVNELKAMDDSGKLTEKLNDLINEEPSEKAPLYPLSGEDDLSGTGTVDELAIIVRRMREAILVKDRFYKMRRFTNCFLGLDAVDFLSEDQYLEREEAVKFGRKLARKHFFQHVLDENEFEDGNHVYRFLDHDPIVMSQCYNIPRGIIDVKPKPILEIASRLRFLMFAMLEAYVSEDGRHVDYMSIQNSEEFFRYLRIVEELQRVEFQDFPREEKIAFFINLYNMMVIHAILTWGFPVGPLDRRKLLGDFKYVVGGSVYSLSAIQNGILRGNQRPPYTLTKPFGLRDKRAQVALPYPEPLVHFALVTSQRSGPALRCYSPGDIDKELMEAARDFMKNGGVIVDAVSKLVSVSKILKWYSVDFGKNELEVLKHAANYLEASKSSELLELLTDSQLKVMYQPYDWGLNC